MNAGLIYIGIWIALAFVVGMAGNPAGAGIMGICACVLALCYEPSKEA